MKSVLFTVLFTSCVAFSRTHQVTASVLLLCIASFLLVNFVILLCLNLVCLNKLFYLKPIHQPGTSPFLPQASSKAVTLHKEG